MILADEVNNDGVEERGMGLLVIGEGRLVNNGGDGGDEEEGNDFIGNKGGEEDGGNDDAKEAVAAVEGGGIGKRLDKASETFGFC